MADPHGSPIKQALTYGVFGRKPNDPYFTSDPVKMSEHFGSSLAEAIVWKGGLTAAGMVLDRVYPALRPAVLTRARQVLGYHEYQPVAQFEPDTNQWWEHLENNPEIDDLAVEDYLDEQLAFYNGQFSAEEALIPLEVL